MFLSEVLKEAPEDVLNADIVRILRVETKIKTVSEFLRWSPQRIAKKCPVLTLKQILNTRRFLILKHTSEVATVATLMIPKIDQKYALKTGLKDFDNILSSGFQTGSIYQVFGPPGVGKTQLMLHLAAKNSSLSKDTLYIDTKNDFSHSRLEDMLSSNSDAPTADLMSKIHLAKVFELDDLLKIMSGLASSQSAPLGDFPEAARLLIVDNLASLVWPELDDKKMKSLVTKLRMVSKDMRKIATLHDVAVVVVNNVTSKLKPSLGKLFDNVANVTLHFEDRNTISVVKINSKLPLRKVASVQVEITESGLEKKTNLKEMF